MYALAYAQAANSSAVDGHELSGGKTIATIESEAYFQSLTDKMRMVSVDPTDVYNYIFYRLLAANEDILPGGNLQSSDNERCATLVDSRLPAAFARAVLEETYPDTFAKFDRTRQGIRELVDAIAQGFKVCRWLRKKAALSQMTVFRRCSKVSIGCPTRRETKPAESCKQPFLTLAFPTLCSLTLSLSHISTVCTLRRTINTTKS